MPDAPICPVMSRPVYVPVECVKHEEYHCIQEVEVHRTETCLTSPASALSAPLGLPRASTTNGVISNRQASEDAA